MVLDKFFGRYGGLWLEDCFKYIAEDLGKQYSELIKSDKFKSEFDSLLNFMGAPKPKLRSVENSELGRKVELLIVDDLGIYCNIVGQMLLAKKMNRKMVSTGASDENQAIISSLIHLKLDIPLKIYLGRELADRSELIDTLNSMDVETNHQTCRELYDMPNLYAFQDWFKNPYELFFLPEKSNIGPYPYPAITGYFYSFLGEFVEETVSKSVEGNGKTNIVVSVNTGTTALGIFDRFVNEEISLFTAEEECKKDMLMDNCCMLTKGCRGGDNTVYRVLCPKILHYWEEKKVNRLFVSPEKSENARKTLAKKEGILITKDSGSALASMTGRSEKFGEGENVFVVVSSELGVR